jgi:hypothetical protein
VNRLDVVAASVLAAVPASALAASGQSVCINPKFSYEAHAMDSHTVAVRNTIGAHQDWAELTTSCLDLKSANRISLASTLTCIGQGDFVFSRTIDGQSRRCRVTGVTPLESYAPDNRG